MKLVVIGAQWGDEGKGKIVDFLAEEPDLVVRFSGGANAGHTIVHGENTYKLHLVPSGIVYEGKTVVLGGGMVIDPESLFNELETLEKNGVSWKGRVFISERAHIVFPFYKDKDKKLEENRRIRIGTTGRGIGIAYAEKAARDGVRMVDIFDEDFYVHMSAEEKAFVDRYTPLLKGMIVNTTELLYKHGNNQILFEGAQGILLDIDGGTYPFVSSGYSNASGAAIGSGIGPRDIDRVLGVFKAYTTRVGNGPFPSEFDEEREKELLDTVRETGNEYGVTTGRARRCGYLDLVALRYAVRSNSIDGLVLTHIDVYDNFDEIQACVAYDVDGETTDIFPARIHDLDNAKPITKTFKGWKKDISKAQSYDELPPEVKDYIKFIEDFTGAGVDIISVGPDRTQTFIRRNPWTK